MAIDETGLLNGELYTILSNKDAKGKKGTIAAFIKGTKADKITTPILDRVLYKTLVSIDELTLDLANNMDWIAREITPNARHTYDRFHVQQLVSDALQAMRVKERWKAIDEENEAILEAKKNKQKYIAPTYSNGDTKKQLLARSRYLLYKTPNKLNSSQKERSKILFEEFPSLKKAYYLSICFRGCYEHCFGTKKAKKKFQKWFAKVEASNLKEMQAAAQSVKNNLGGILNYFYKRETNASAESFNAKLKLFRQRVRGIKDKNFFFFRIFQYFS